MTVTYTQGGKTNTVANSAAVPVGGTVTDFGDSAKNASYGVTPGAVTPTPYMASDGARQTNTPSPKNTTSPTTTPVVPTKTASGSSYTGNSIVDALNQNGQASDINSRSALAKSYGLSYDVNASGSASADQNTKLLNKYTQGLTNAQNNGGTPPDSSADASAKVKENLPQDTPPKTDYSDMFANDPGMQQLIADHKAYTDYITQQQSLTDQYKQMTADAGIPALNTELMNMKNVIDGTENDLRTEITKAGGFATNSQVMALTDARNKVMIQNYNNLLTTKQQAIDNINTMIGLSKEDRANAISQFTEQMNFDQKISDYTQKMTTNAQTQYNNIIGQVGYDGLLKMAQASRDPQAVSRIEKTLGLGAGQLQGLASQPNLDRQIKEATLAKTKADTAKIYSDMNGGVGGSAIDKAVTKQNALQDAADKQTVNSNYQQIQGLFPGKDLNNLTKSDVANLSKADQITIGKALARIQNPDLARAGGDPGNALSASGIPEWVGEQFHSTFTGKPYTKSKIFDAIKTANSLYKQRNLPSIQKLQSTASGAGYTDNTDLQSSIDTYGAEAVNEYLNQ